MRRASTICLVRDEPSYQVLMVQRPRTSRFMPSVWVFPGGAVDEADAHAPSAFGGADDWSVAALRELIEETGIWLTAGGAVARPLAEHAFDVVQSSDLVLDPSALVYFANWVTPEPFPVRFDTRFFLAAIDGGIHGAVDGDELVDLAWIDPLEALERSVEGTFDIAFPTQKTLELLASEASAAAIANAIAPMA